MKFTRIILILSIQHVSGLEGGRSNSSSCVTVSGGDIGVPCVFPFIFMEKSYNSCTVENAPDRLPWCSTLLDSHGVHMGGMRKWGHCARSCAVVSEGESISSNCVTVGGGDTGASCVFPFTFMGNSYDGCTVDNAPDGLPWCSTLVNSHGVHMDRMGKWGHCTDGCKVDSRMESGEWSNSSSCVTVGGGDMGASCVFPFIFMEKSYNGCTVDNAPDRLPWCSTRIDSHGVHMGGMGKWGYCAYGCKIDSGIDSSNGTCLTSPTFPKKYKINSITTQEFSVLPAQYMEIEFKFFDIQKDSNCQFDYLQFYDGNGQMVGKKMCGSSVPSTFRISTPNAKTYFKSDDKTTKRGYKFCYKSVDSAKLPVSCGNQSAAVCSECRPTEAWCGGSCIWDGVKCIVVFVELEGMACNSDLNSNNISLDECKAACRNNFTCGGIMRKTKGQENNGPCYFVNDKIKIEDCITNPPWNAYTLHRKPKDSCVNHTAKVLKAYCSGDCMWDGVKCTEAPETEADKATETAADKGICEEKDTFYRGGILISGIIVRGIDECGKYCYLDNACQFWIFRRSDNACWIKYGDAEIQIMNGYDSGPRGCRMNMDDIDVANIAVIRDTTSNIEEIKVYGEQNKNRKGSDYMMKVDEDLPVSYQVSSKAGAAQHKPSLMGVYVATGDLINKFPIFKNNHKYLYVGSNGRWAIGSSAGSTRSSLYHPKRKPTPAVPPVIGWIYSSNGWHTDPTLQVVKVLECYTEKDYIYKHFDIGAPNVQADWKACRNSAVGVSAAYYWTFRLADRRCWLKSSNKHRTSDGVGIYISGNAGCRGDVAEKRVKAMDYHLGHHHDDVLVLDCVNHKKATTECKCGDGKCFVGNTCAEKICLKECDNNKKNEGTERCACRGLYCMSGETCAEQHCLAGTSVSVPVHISGVSPTSNKDTSTPVPINIAVASPPPNKVDTSVSVPVNVSVVSPTSNKDTSESVLKNISVVSPLENEGTTLNLTTNITVGSTLPKEDTSGKVTTNFTVVSTLLNEDASTPVPANIPAGLNKSNEVDTSIPGPTSISAGSDLSNEVDTSVPGPTSISAMPDLSNEECANDKKATTECKCGNVQCRVGNTCIVEICLQECEKNTKIEGKDRCTCDGLYCQPGETCGDRFCLAADTSVPAPQDMSDMPALSNEECANDKKATSECKCGNVQCGIGNTCVEEICLQECERNKKIEGKERCTCDGLYCQPSETCVERLCLADMTENGVKTVDYQDYAAKKSPIIDIAGYPLREFAWKAPNLHISLNSGMKDGKMVTGGIIEEFRQLMDNLKKTLAKVCADLSDIMETTIYITNMDDANTVNSYYSLYFSSPYPLRSVVEVNALPLGAKLQMKAVALVKKDCK